MSHHQSTESKIKEANQEGGRRDDRKEAVLKQGNTFKLLSAIFLNCDPNAAQLHLNNN